MRKYSFIARMPDDPGTLQRTAGIIKKYEGNINRIQFDRRIDHCTVFFEVTAPDESCDLIAKDLAALGYLQTSLKSLSFLKFHAYLPNRAGALYEFLDFTTSAGANIASVDFDDAGRHPDRLTVSLNLEETAAIDRLLDQLKSRYRLEILEYDTTGKHLDDTVFYVRFAQEIRALIGESEDEFLLSFLGGTNHIVQELMDRGNDPRQVFDSVLATGRTLKSTTGQNFYADVQRFRVSDVVELCCFQLPCGGNIFVLDNGAESLMIDTGFGLYHQDVMTMLSSFGLGGKDRFRQIVVSHADGDHCGAGGFFDTPARMHTGALAIIKTSNRAYGSRSDHSVLDSLYTKMINLFSQFTLPRKIDCFPAPDGITRGIFPKIGTVQIGDVMLDVLDGLGGHTIGQIFLYDAVHGLLFTADSVINFSSISPERATYMSLAAFLVTSVNVDSDLAKKERHALLDLAAETDRKLSGTGRRCLVCGGHGAVSVLEDGKLVAVGECRRYQPAA